MNAMPRDESFREGAPFPSPVLKILALGYYDGPTNGLLQCEAGRAYCFEMLAWDRESQNLRVFGFAPIPADAFDRLAELCARCEKPRWPVWLPSWYEEWDEEADAILGQAGPVEWVAAAEDLMGTILAAKRVGPGDVRVVNDWGPFLGLAVDAPILSDQLP